MGGDDLSMGRWSELMHAKSALAFHALQTGLTYYPVVQTHIGPRPDVWTYVTVDGYTSYSIII